MNTEVLERLLIDHDAGELSPDVEALLEHHLRQDPLARRKAAELDETLRLARLALTGAQTGISPFRRPDRGIRTWALGVAACLLFTFQLGVVAIRERHGSPLVTDSIPARTVAAEPTGGDSGFWSAERLRAAVSASRPEVAEHFYWKSPVRKPELSSK